MAFNTSTVARWTILSSSAGTPSGLGRPSAFGMYTLVLADNLLLLFMAWEIMGLCSYLLIGFWYTDPANGRAARKAFIVTRYFMRHSVIFSVKPM